MPSTCSQSPAAATTEEALDEEELSEALELLDELREELLATEELTSEELCNDELETLELETSELELDKLEADALDRDELATGTLETDELDAELGCEELVPAQRLPLRVGISALLPPLVP